MALGTSVLAANFTAGNLVVYRVGTGVAGSLTNRGSVVFLDEYMTNGTFVQSIQIRTNYFGANSPLLGDGTSAIDGLLTRSTDGRFIVLAGYGATLGQFTNFALIGTFANEAPRVVGFVDGSGNIKTTTAMTNSLLDGSTVRSAASTDGTNIWFTGNPLGVNYTTRGSNDETRVTTSSANTRQSNVFSNQLYFSAGGTNPRLGTPTNACCYLPTSTNALFASLPGVPTDTNQPIAFVLLKLNAGGADPLDTLYFTDDGTLQGSSVQKFSLVGGTWVNNGSIAGINNPVGLAGATRIVGTTTNVDLFITQGGATLTGGGNIAYVADPTGYNAGPSGSPALIYDGSVAGFAKGLRGIVFAPVGTEPGVPGQISVGPLLEYRPRGLTGGPFSPGTNNYSVANLGTNTVTWGASVVADGNWLTLSPTSGSLASNASTTVIATVNAAADSLIGGSNYAATITFTNAIDHLGDTIRLASLRVFALTVTTASNNVSCGVTNTATNFDSIGPDGGPFCPLTYVYTISNTASSATSWSITNGASWFNISATNGTLAGDAATNITLTINSSANDLSRGYRATTLYFNDTTPGHDISDITRRVSLAIDIGFYDDFSTFSPGNLIGQQSWVLQDTAGQDNVTLPIQVTNGAVRIPGPTANSNHQDARKETGYTNYTSVFYGTVSIVSTAGPSDGTPSFVLALRTASNGGGFNNYRISARQDGAGGYVFATALAGFSAWGFETTGSHSFGSTNIWICKTDPDGTNSVIFVNPTSPVIPETTNVVSVSNSGTAVGSVVLSQFESETAKPAGMSIRKISVSRNYAQVYDELKAGAYANFGASPTNGAAPLLVNFTDRSSGTPLTWAWDFGDVTTSTATNPSHTYAGGGTYTVRLIVTGPTGSSTNTQVGLITVTGPPADPFVTWQTNYFPGGGPNAAASADPDGDGVSNTNEFLTGFNPTNAAAFARVTSIGSSGGGTNQVITYLGASGDSTYFGGPASRTNVLEFTPGTNIASVAGNYTNNFTSTGLTNVLSGGTGLGASVSQTISGAATNKPARYYRVRVLSP